MTGDRPGSLVEVRPEPLAEGGPGTNAIVSGVKPDGDPCAFGTRRTPTVFAEVLGYVPGTVAARYRLLTTSHEGKGSR